MEITVCKIEIEGTTSLKTIKVYDHVPAEGDLVSGADYYTGLAESGIVWSVESTYTYERPVYEQNFAGF